MAATWGDLEYWSDLETWWDPAGRATEGPVDPVVESVVEVFAVNAE